MYKEADSYRFDHATRPPAIEEYNMDGDDGLTYIGMELLKLKQKEKNDRSGEQGSPSEWRGNDIY